MSLWGHLPVGMRERGPFVVAGAWIHKLALRFSGRSQTVSTWFMRNGPLLLSIRDLLDNFEYGEKVRLCVVGCSTGAEMYSVLWTLRSARPDLKILPIGIDISESAVAKAKKGRYSKQDSELTGGILHSRSTTILSEEVLAQLFDADGDGLRIKNCIAEGIRWEIANASDPSILSKLGQQQIVVANNLLVHMKRRESTACLGNIIRLIAPGGFLVCRGVELDLREQAVRQFGLIPVQTRVEEIHNADFWLDARCDWPWKYWGLEPLNKRRRNWLQRYASILQVPPAPHSLH